MANKIPLRLPPKTPQAKELPKPLCAISVSARTLPPMPDFYPRDIAALTAIISDCDKMVRSDKGDERDDSSDRETKASSTIQNRRGLMCFETGLIALLLGADNAAGSQSSTSKKL